MKPGFIAILFCAALMACTMRGTKIDPAQLLAVTKGQTTRDDVESEFGMATATTIKSDGTTSLTYTYVPPSKAETLPFFGSPLNAAQSRTQTATFVFDSTNRLESYTQSNILPDNAGQK